MVTSTSHTTVDALLEHIDARNSHANTSTFTLGPFSVFQIDNPRKRLADCVGADGDAYDLAACNEDEITVPTEDVALANLAAFPGVDEQNVLSLLQQDPYCGFDSDAGNIREHSDGAPLDDSHSGLMPEDHQQLSHEDVLLGILMPRLQR